ncbi:DUF1641 domain-containing protein, partial [Bacillus sporothermodurans]|uniref:DUF1641 domain-containing protein n=3 Tax=Heyndrickxia sporothermodurans TaxID=46224 RepID=UPI00192AD85C
YMRCLNGGLLVNYHYTRFGEVLLFLSLKPLDTQGLRIMKFIQVLKEKNILPVITAILTKNDNNDSTEIGKITNGIKKGVESSMESLNAGKELNTFQLMKLMKDPDINRAITFLLAFLKGMGKSL